MQILAFSREQLLLSDTALPYWSACVYCAVCYVSDYRACVLTQLWRNQNHILDLDVTGAEFLGHTNKVEILKSASTHQVENRTSVTTTEKKRWESSLKSFLNVWKSEKREIIFWIHLSQAIVWLQVNAVSSP